MVRKFKSVSLLVLCTFAATVWYAVFYFESHQHLEVTFFDIGQGDSIFIEAPNGNQILIDGGPDASVLSKLGKTLPFWDHSLDVLLLTHAHADHVDGLIEVLKRYHVGMIVESGEAYSTPDYHEWHRIIQEKNIPVTIAHEGEIIDAGGGVLLTMLSPFADANGVSFKNPHDANVSSRLSYGSTSVLLMGDAEKPMEYRLIRENPDTLGSIVLKVGHHGSKTSSSQEFLDAIHPAYAVISVGRHNRYGHPHLEVLDRLTSSGIKIFRTDVNGDVLYESNGKDFSITAIN